MKVAVVVEKNIPSAWAHDVNTVKHAQGFANVADQAVIVYRSSTNFNEIKSFYGLTEKVQGKKYSLSNIDVLFNQNLSKYFLEKCSSIIGFDITYFANTTKKSIAKILKEEHVDVAYVRSYTLAKYLPLQGIKTVLEMHSANIQKPQIKSLAKIAQNPSFLGIITISPKLIDLYEKAGFYRNKMLWQEDAVHVSQVAAAKPLDLTKTVTRKNGSGKIVHVLYAGSLHPDKGTNDILTIAEKAKNDQSIKKSDIQLVFHLVGAAKDRAKDYSFLAKERGLDNIIFHGAQKPIDIAGFLKGADILIAPYPKQPKNSLMDQATTSPIKFFEYMAAGKPIITSQIPSAKRLQQKCSGIATIALGDNEKFYAKIKQIIQDEVLQNAMSKSCSKCAKEFSYGIRCKKIIEVLAS